MHRLLALAGLPVEGRFVGCDDAHVSYPQFDLAPVRSSPVRVATNFGIAICANRNEVIGVNEAGARQVGPITTVTSGERSCSFGSPA